MRTGVFRAYGFKAPPRTLPPRHCMRCRCLNYYALLLCIYYAIITRFIPNMLLQLVSLYIYICTQVLEHEYIVNHLHFTPYVVYK